MRVQDMCRVDIGRSGPMGARNVVSGFPRWVSLRGPSGPGSEERMCVQGFAGRYHKKKCPAFLFRVCALRLITTARTSKNIDQRMRGLL
jgi:hypothetical protein